MPNLYITADKLGLATGGGLVTQQESEALQSLGETDVWSRDQLEGGSDPWGYDEVFSSQFMRNYANRTDLKLAHGYAGSFSNSVNLLKGHGVKVSWTVAAHDVEISRREHLVLGLPFNYPHLNDLTLFQRYIGGYKQADVIIAPGKVPEQTMRKQGLTNRIEIIPHGTDIPNPEKVKPFPKSFRCGYLGSFGADKGVRYLLEAWKKLNYNDAVLVLGGRDSLHPWVGNLVDQFGGGQIVRVGWVNNVADFYNSLSLYVQPSATEGFGLETLEAFSYNRPVLCSDGAGAVDLVPESWRVRACDSDHLAERIEFFRRVPHLHNTIGLWNRKQAEKHSWGCIRERYVNLWKELVN